MTLSRRSSERDDDSWAEIGRVSAITVYPVKGFGGQDVQSARVLPWGLEGDRLWCVVDPDGVFMSQRRHPQMATIRASLVPDGVALQCPSLGSMIVASPSQDDDLTTIKVWNDVVRAGAASSASAAWLSAALNTPCRLVRMARPDSDRAIGPPYAAAGDTVSFADGFPLLGTATASLDQLRDWIRAPDLPMNRFRSNLVIETSEPWIEDRWTTIVCGDVVLEAPKPCTRCVVIKTDQTTGERANQPDPLRALAQRHAGPDGHPVFGQNLIPRSAGVIRTGDVVLMAPP